MRRTNSSKLRRRETDINPPSEAIIGANQKTVWNADGSLNALTYDPERLVLVIDKDHPLYDERVNLPVDDAMVRNVMVNGILQPIVIALDPESGEVLVVAGRQRVKAAREANRRLAERGEAQIRVPAMPRKGTGSELAGVVVSENEIRQPDGALVKASKMRRLENLGWSVEEIAVAFGINDLTVKNHLELIDCGAAVKKGVEAGYIGISDVRYLARLTPAQQTAKVAELVSVQAGKTGHAKAKAKREVIRGSDEKPKMKGRKEIQARVVECRASGSPESLAMASALVWAMGKSEDQIEAATDTKTGDLSKLDEVEA